MSLPSTPSLPLSLGLALIVGAVFAGCLSHDDGTNPVCACEFTDTASDTGDTAADTGDTAGDTGDTAGDTGDSGVHL